jgi:hypothetical protein
VIDSLAAPSHLLQRSMRDRFRDKVGEIVFEANTETALCIGAVKIVQDCFPDPGAKTFDLCSGGHRQCAAPDQTNV